MRRLLTALVPYLIVCGFIQKIVGAASPAAVIASAIGSLFAGFAMGIIMGQWASRGPFYETHYYFRKSIGAIFAMRVPDGYDLKSVEPWGPLYVVKYRKQL